MTINSYCRFPQCPGYCANGTISQFPGYRRDPGHRAKQRVCVYVCVYVYTPAFFRSKDICITVIFSDTRQTGSFRTYAISFSV